MKKRLLLIFNLALPYLAFTQCTIGSGTTPGIFPDIIENLSAAYINNPYNAVLQVRTPKDTTISGTYVTLTSIQITGITNLPPGFSYTCSPSSCSLGPLKNGCMEISGNPTAAIAGTYPLTIEIKVSGKLYGIIPMSQQTQLTDYKIKIFGPPSANFSISKYNICPNEPLTFSDISTNRPTTFQWDFPGGTPSKSTLENPVISYAQSGDYTVTLKVTSPAGQSTITKKDVLHVTIAPEADLLSDRPDTICGGDSVRIETAQLPGNTYSWLKNGTIIQGATDYFYYAKSTGDYKVDVTRTLSGCTTRSSKKPVQVETVNSTITAAGNTSVCNPQKVTLLANNSATYQYTWFKNNVAISYAKTSSFQAGGTGNYQVRITNGHGCMSTSPAISVKVYSKPSPTITALGPLSFCQGKSVKLKTITGGTPTYIWYRNNNVIGGATTKIYEAFKQGDYKVKVTSIHGCIGTSPVTKVTINCREEEDNLTLQNSDKIQLHPNPASTETILALSSQSNGPLTVLIYDAIGKLKMQIPVGAPETGRMEIALNTSSLSSGIYFVKVISSVDQHTLKLVIRK